MIFEKTKKNNYCFISPKQKKKHFENHLLYQKLTTRCQKIVKSVSNHFWKLLINFGDQLSMGTNCPWGPIVLGTICPGGPNVWGPIVQGDQLSWGPFVHGDQMSWDCLFLGTNCGGPNVRGLNGFGTK